MLRLEVIHRFPNSSTISRGVKTVYFNWEKVRRLALNRRWPAGYRPDLSDLRRIRPYLPKGTIIIGFGTYKTLVATCWYLDLYNEGWDNSMGTPNMSERQLMGMPPVNPT